MTLPPFEASDRLASALARLAVAREDESAWRDLFDTTWPYLIAISYHPLGERRDLAEEVSQETFVRVARYAEFTALREPSAFRAYVRTICRNVIHTMWRAEHLETRANLFLKAHLEARADSGEISSAAPDEAVDARTSLMSILPHLSESDQRLLAWLVDGYSLGEMVVLAQVTDGAMRVRIHRLRNILRRLLPSTGLIPPPRHGDTNRGDL